MISLLAYQHIELYILSTIQISTGQVTHISAGAAVTPSYVYEI